MNSLHNSDLMFLLISAIAAIIGILLWLIIKIRAYTVKKTQQYPDIKTYVDTLDAEKVEILIKSQKSKRSVSRSAVATITGLLLAFQPQMTMAGNLNPLLAMNPATSNATKSAADSASIFSEPGILITIILIAIPLIGIVLFMAIRLASFLRKLQARANEKHASALADYLQNIDDEDIGDHLLKRKMSLDYQLSNSELSGFRVPKDDKGFIHRTKKTGPLDFVARKMKVQAPSNIDPNTSRLILWYLGCAAFWLLFGTTVGEYLGIKFVSPDIDHQSWLSFGRLRPVHTNAVFWGWSSLAMIGLGYYVVPVVSNTSIYNLRHGWISLLLINLAVLAGSISLMSGINNSGGEYREYVWPIMSLFGLGLIITLFNFIRTIAARTTHEIYISNWYIVSAIMFTLVITVVAYWPSWQDGLGETIIQGYYMHQGVGMWFMLFNLGLVYYFLPQQLNKPIYSYSLGILAFWTQILFYTLIGTHHFVFSSIPWWLQTVAIVGSVGMLIPVTAGTINFYMTFKGAWTKIASSYTLPFFLVGIVFYFTGSYQGTAEAFRFTNQLWHFTDFTVAHSHLTMYGIISFLLWGCIYVVVPRLTGNEPPQLTVGAHFWLALVGLMFYTIPLMIGGTLKGMSWMEGKPFIESVVLMAPYWLWRAIGGTMMWISHLFFAYNFIRMAAPAKFSDVETIAFEKLESLSLTSAKN